MDVAGVGVPAQLWHPLNFTTGTNQTNTAFSGINRWMGSNHGRGSNDTAFPIDPNILLNTSFMSREDIERIVRANHVYVGGSNFDTTTQIVLIVAFAVLIVFGATGNGLVCYVVAKNAHMRSPRNIFIINLAISDLTLCLFTQPCNLLKVSMQTWRLGDFMCKFLAMFAGTNVFVSTISITAIALDRFQVIVYPTKDSVKKVGAICALISIWAISLLMASPLLIFNSSKKVEIVGVELYRVCLERPNLHYEKGAYSVASMIFQYIVPIVIVTVAHARICNKLKYRMINQQPIQNVNSPFQRRKNAREAKRKRRTNTLLVSIAVVFACSWMPLNIFNIMADFDIELLQAFDKKGLVFPICHLLVLYSACANPVLFGWLNENFRREFINVLCSPCCKRLRAHCGNETSSQRSGPDTQQTSSVVLYSKSTNGTSNHLTVNPTDEEVKSLNNTQVSPHSNVTLQVT